MSLQLYVAIDNAREQLSPLLPHYAEGRLTQPELPHAFGILFRQLGTCRMLVEGVAAPLFVGQMQAASCYLFGLPALPPEEKVTSLAACWWDAIAGGYWGAARDIARLSRATPNLNREHEDDFLYVMFLMQRYFLTPDASNIEARAAHDQEQLQILERWNTVLEGAVDPKLDLCRALQDRDAQAFQDALLAVGDQRRASLEQMEAKGSLLDEQALWVKPVWPEGLALLRLAEVEGLGGDFDCPDVPPLVRVRPPFRYDANAWRDIDFRPVKH
jgi:hypothetical protein